MRHDNDSLNKRNQWLDIAKGIAIILMVLGHSSIPRFASNFIWSFHMPLFFIASGWCTDWGKENFIKFLFRKMRVLLIPFVVYSAIILAIEISININTFDHWITKGWEGYALWFIPVIFLALIMAKLVMMLPTDTLRIFMAIVIAGGGAFLRYNAISAPWTICSVPYACALIILGSYIKHLQNWFDKPRWWILLVCFALVVLISHYWRLDIAWNDITPVTILTIGAVSGTAMTFTISSYINKKCQVLSKVFQAIGKETYLILAFSQITMKLMNLYVSSNVAIKCSALIIVITMLAFCKNKLNQSLKFRLL